MKDLDQRGSLLIPLKHRQILYYIVFYFLLHFIILCNFCISTIYMYFILYLHCVIYCIIQYYICLLSIYKYSISIVLYFPLKYKLHEGSNIICLLRPTPCPESCLAYRGSHNTILIPVLINFPWKSTVISRSPVQIFFLD